MLSARLLLLFALWLPAAAVCLAQQPDIALGQWRSHFPHNEALTVTKAGPRIYCGTVGGFFYYDLEDNSMHTLSKAEGFSDVGVQKVAHDPHTNITLVAYTNTNIDLITPDGRIHNLSDILRKPIIGAKAIRHVYFAGGLAYVSTSFGVVVIDLAKREIKNTYSNLGANGRVLDVYATTTLRDSIYITAIDSNRFRVMRARISNNNLLDFNNWSTFSLSTFPQAGIRVMATFNNKIYVGVDHQGVYYFNGTSWQVMPALSNVGGGFTSMTLTPNSLLVSTEYNVREVFSPTHIEVINHHLINYPAESIRSNPDEFWIADLKSGLLRVRGYHGIDGQQFRPNGPWSIAAFDLWSANNQVVVTAGAVNKSIGSVQTHNRSGFYVFSGGEWTNYNSALLPDPQQYPVTEDLIEVVQDPATGTLYLGSYGYGLIKWNGPGNFQVYDDTNSPLVNALAPGSKYVRVSGLAIDENRTLWVVVRHEKNSGAAPSLFALKPDGVTWEPHTIIHSQSGFLEQIAIDNANQKWIIVSYNVAGGIIVYNDKTQTSKYLTTDAASGRLPSLIVNSITKDLNGAMWVGTDNGVGVYYSPSQIMNANYQVDPRPIIDGRYLLENQLVNDIAVDGGNRKWIAAESGLWLFNETGTELLAHFTTENSPLPSNRVNKVIINHTSGEVFAATDRGLVSYRGAATITETNTACSGVFPNPVRNGFTGQVGISGVPSNAVVKITDITGTLVYEARANGNTATWNLRDYNGKRVQKGIYLLMSASPDGSEKFSCKVAVLE